MCTSEPTSFWRENVIAVLILLDCYGFWRKSRTEGNKFSSVGSFIQRSRKGLTSFNKNNSANFSGKKVQWSFSECRYFENPRYSLYSPTFSVLIFMSELSFVGLCFSRSSASSMANSSSKVMTSVTPFVSWKKRFHNQLQLYRFFDRRREK